MKQIISPLLRIGICTAGYLYATSNVTLAQVTSDGTVNTQVNQNGSIAEITGGETRGSNLFHSFQDFSVPAGNEAFFNNANDISNILSRVTGGNISNIDGAIRANGSASLFLINPAGIIFGEGARLDLGGSFYGSTASSILFEDGEFSAADLENPPLLTVNAPIGLGFRDNPGDIVTRFQEVVTRKEITNEGFDRVFSEFPDGPQPEIEDIIEDRIENGENFAEVLLDLGIISPQETVDVIIPLRLEVDQGNNFALIGGNVSIDNFVISGEEVTLGGLSQAGIVTFNQDGSLNFPEGVARGNVSFGVSSIDAIGLSTISASSIYTYAKKADFNTLRIFADNNLLIDASESVNIDNSSIEPQSFTISIAPISLDRKVNITTDNLTLTNTSTISGDRISINAFNSFIINNDSFITGSMEITTANLAITNGSNIGRFNFFEEDSFGSISINVSDSLIIDGVSSSGSSSSITSSGQDVNINTTDLAITNGGLISTRPLGGTGSITDSFGTRQLFGIINGGNISINALGSVIIRGTDLEESSDGAVIGTGFEESSSGIFSNIFNIPEGSSGDIHITTRDLVLTNGGQIAAVASGEGELGNISIDASESINIDSFFSGIFNQVEQDAEGVGSEINVVTKDLRLTNGGQISAVTRGEGNAGNLNINTSNLDVKGINSGLFSRTAGSGNAGIVDIKTSQLQVQDNAQVGVDNFVPVEFQIEQLDNRLTRVIPIFNPVEGSGSAGNLRITAESIDLQSGGSLTAISAGGNGGNINLNSDLLTFRDGGNISATAGLENTSGSGGNINIDSQFIVAFPDGNNDITANAFSGAGGNISIATEGIFGIQERPNNPLTNDITASSEAGISGNVTITTPDINPVQGATELSTNVVEPGETTQQVCQANRETAAKNGLTISGKGGIVPDPALPLNSLNVTVNGKINPTSTIPAPIDTSQGKIQPARGIKVTESGKIILTAYRTNNAGERIPSSSVNCGRA